MLLEQIISSTTAMNYAVSDDYSSTLELEWSASPTLGMLLDSAGNNLSSWWPTNDTTTASTSKPSRHLGPVWQALITFFYLFGISGNVTALVMLGRNETARNRRQILMLRCLAWNDLLAMTCSCALMYMQLYVAAEVTSSRWVCGVRVFVRTFGLGSGSVAIVMAIERCLALTRPFLYQQHVTYHRIRCAVFLMWSAVALLVCLPFFGFGLYYNENETPKCVRYRMATQPSDVAYAYLYFAFGLLMCLCITWCNLAVVAVLCGLRRGTQPGSMAVAVRRSTAPRRLTPDGRILYSPATQGEIAFAKLMVALCIFFVVCWLPQMVFVVMSLVAPAANRTNFYRLADIGIALNFALNPYVYVLTRRRTRMALAKLLKSCGGKKNCTNNGSTDAEFSEWNSSSRDDVTTLSTTNSADVARHN